MATLLLVIIYAGYISLGIPDSLLGAAWPAIYTDLNLPLSYMNFITSVTCVGTIVMSFFSARLIKFLGTGRIVVFSTLLTALALLGFSASDRFIWLCLLAFPLGLGAGAIDTALNNYVAENYSASHMNFLHCFYGVGVTISPYIMSLSLKHLGSWRTGYRISAIIQLVITGIAVLSLPIWKRVRESKAEIQETEIVPFSKLIADPSVRAVTLAFMFSVSIECICSSWGSTFLVNAKGYSADAAAAMITFYYIGLTMGRFCSGVLAKRLTGWQLIFYGAFFTLSAIVIFFLPLPPAFSGLALFLVGFGNGPVFPNLTHLTPRYFGSARSGSVIGFEMSCVYVSVLLTPVIFGLLAQYVSIWLFAPCLIIAFIAFILAAAIFNKLYQKKTNMENNK